MESTESHFIILDDCWFVHLQITRHQANAFARVEKVRVEHYTDWGIDPEDWPGNHGLVEDPHRVLTHCCHYTKRIDVSTLLPLLHEELQQERDRIK